MAWGICRTQGGMHAKLLWTNPNPTSSYPSSNIALNLSSFDFKLIEYKYDATDTQTHFCISKIGDDCALAKYVIETLSNSITRLFAETATGMTCASAYVGSNQNNLKMIPVNIFGLTGKISGEGID